LRSTHQQGITGCSDTRGQHPYLPIIEGQTILCPQLPTTLPSLNELLLREGRDINRISQELLDYTYHAPTCGHVYTLHAEHEGGKLLYPFEQLIEGWKKQGYRFITLGEFSALAQRHAGGLLSLPRHAIQFNSESQQGMAYRI
jgi:peptidoglycan/xylan/chitin deacetylase (PgdA/CDA1 family)